MTKKKDFIEKLCDSFPLMKDDLLDEDYEGLFSLQIGVFRDYTQRSIDSNDFDQVDLYIKFIDDNYDKFEDEVENGIVISYIEKLNFNNYPISSKYKNIQNSLRAYADSTYLDEKLISTLKQNTKK